MCKNYYPQVFLKECKHIGKENEMTRHITENFEISLNESDESEEYFSFNEHLKKIHKHEKLVLCKLLPSLNHPLD